MQRSKATPQLSGGGRFPGGSQPPLDVLGLAGRPLLRVCSTASRPLPCPAALTLHPATLNPSEASAAQLNVLPVVPATRLRSSLKMRFGPVPSSSLGAAPAPCGSS